MVKSPTNDDGFTDDQGVHHAPGCWACEPEGCCCSLGCADTATERLADAGTTQSAPEPSQAATETHSDDGRRKSILFNDITHAPTMRHVIFSDRLAIRDYLWAQGWRRDVRPEDVTERRGDA